MKKTLFITGAGGFIGSNVLKAVRFEEYENIFCLGRKENDVTRRYSEKSNVRFIKGDISEPESYARFLDSADIVLHLAALTGKAGPEEYFRTNTEGTRILVEQSVKSSIQKFIFISSIAADFKNVGGYYYAQSKIDAENLIKKSGLPFAILRPAIVTGPGAPLLKSFLQLAKAPVVPVFGDGKTMIQPVYIDDLVQCILHVIENDDLQDRTVTVAGPEQISVEAFIRDIHDRSFRKKFRVIHLPVSPIRKVLLKLEKKYLAYLPFTAGQLASFINNGITDRNPCFDGVGTKLKNIDEMLRLSLIPDEQAGSTPEELKKECKTLTRYLINRDPEDYIQDKYVQAHQVTGMGMNAGFFDTLLVKAANRSPFSLKLADAYTSILYKNAVLRNKLLLVLAILECSDSAYSDVNRVDEGAAGTLIAQLTKKTFVFLLTLVAAVIVFTPFKFLSDRMESAGKRAES